LKLQKNLNAVNGSLVRFATGVDWSKQSVASSESFTGSHQLRAQIGTQPSRLPNWGTFLLVIIFCCLPVSLFGRTTSVIKWNTPAAITFGTALSSAQLNATATIPGTFAYSPASGTILSAGSKTLSVTFTPTDTASYSTVTTSVTVTVEKATPTIIWATPGAIDSGTRLSSKQLDATTSLSGTLVYSPAADTLLATGTRTLTVIFTPTDTGNYNDASASVSLRVYGGVPALSINSTSVSFGGVELGQPATQTLTLSSTGSASLTVKSAAISGAGYKLSGSTLPVTLATGQTATLGVEFDPTVAGAASGTLTVSSTSSSNGTATVALSGTGTAASYTVDLSWDAPVDSAVPVAGYRIYRSPGGSSSYQLLNSSVDALTSYVDSTVQAGDSYDYEVESVDASGVASAPTSPIAVVVP
jgi:hypothetical protein